MMMGERRRGLLIFKHLINKVQKLLQTLHSRSPDHVDAVEFEEAEETGNVKQGHFAIVAGKDIEEEGQAQSFVVKLCVLKNPVFLELLELAEEEYGFEQKGALTRLCPKNSNFWDINYAALM